MPRVLGRRWTVQPGTPALGAANAYLGPCRVGGFCREPCPIKFLMIQPFSTSAAQLRTLSCTAPLTLGRYRISANPRPLVGGRFAAFVSIASGTGSASTDRVMRFHEDFPTHEAAARYALAQGIDWVRDAARPSPYPN